MSNSDYGIYSESEYGVLMFFFFTSGALSPLARAVSAEIRSEMAVQRVTGRALAGAAGYASHNYVAERLRDEKPFTLDDVDRLCRAMDVDSADLIQRAWRNHGPRLQLEADEAGALELEREAAVVEFRSRYLDPDVEKSPEQILDEVDEELAARRQANDPTAGSGGFLERAAQVARAALEAEAARAAERMDVHLRDTRPARTREEMQQVDDLAARDEDTKA